VFVGYRIHDARRSYTLRLMNAGAPIKMPAAQLGRSSTAMVAKVYGKFKANVDEVCRWENLAAARDAEMEKQRKQSRIASA
jgi:integrase